MLLTAKASWYSKTSMSAIVSPALSRIRGVAKAGLKRRITFTSTEGELLKEE